MRLSSHKTARESKLELSMTSMIDVVFLLLIFFVITAAIIKTEREHSSNVAKQRQSASAMDDQRPAIITIKGGASGVFVYELGSRQFGGDLAELNSPSPVALPEVLKEYPWKDRGAFVVVSDDAKFEMPAKAIHLCKRAGFATVTYVPLDDTR